MSLLFNIVATFLKNLSYLITIFCYILLLYITIFEYFPQRNFPPAPTEIRSWPFSHLRHLYSGCLPHDDRDSGKYGNRLVLVQGCRGGSKSKTSKPKVSINLGSELWCKGLHCHEITKLPLYVIPQYAAYFVLNRFA